MRKSVCIILISIKDYLKIDDEDGFSFSIPCLVLEIFVFYNIIEGRSGSFVMRDQIISFTEKRDLKNILRDSRRTCLA